MIPRFALPSDASLVEEICTHPEVRKWTAPSGGGFDVTQWFHPSNMVVLVDHGCFLSNWLGDTTFGVHTNILPEGRGKMALRNGGLALMLAFLSSNAETFLTMVPGDNPQALWFTRAMRFRWIFRQPGRWEAAGRKWDMDHWRLDIDDWILQGHLTSVGRAFHKELEALGHPASHREDDVHDAYVGALMGMVGAGKPQKGVKVYNRWARVAGYQTLRIDSLAPVTIDAGEFTVRLPEGKLEIIMKEMEHA